MIDARQLRTDLSRAYRAYNNAVRASVQPQIMGWVCLEVLDGIETLAATDRSSRIAALHAQLLKLLADSNLVTSVPLRDEFRKVYCEAEELAFPATTVFVAHAQALTDWTRNLNLITADPSRLRAIDLKAHTDPTFGKYVTKICEILPDVGSAPNVKRYSQFYEIYSEALVLEFLRSKIRTKRVSEEDTETPDFQCELEDGRSFYVEVKTLDIVGGVYRHDAIMVDAIDQAVELQGKIAKGETVAIAEGEIAPYKRPGETDTYDSHSLMRVINTLREKCWQAFKPGQFTLGPTLALAVADRLSIPGRHCALAPYYFDPYDGGSCVSGVLWQAAFGRAGTPILRLPDFAGKPTVEGYLSEPGLYVDEGRSFPGLALIALSGSGEQQAAHGLYPARRAPIGAWEVDDTIEALAAICDAYNDDGNSQAFELSHYSPNGPSKSAKEAGDPLSRLTPNEN